MSQDEAHIDDIREARALTAERLRHHDAEQALLTDLCERLAGKACLRIHPGRVRPGRLGCRARARRQIAGANVEDPDPRRSML